MKSGKCGRLQGGRADYTIRLPVSLPISPDSQVSKSGTFLYGDLAISRRPSRGRSEAARLEVEKVVREDAVPVGLGGVKT